MGKKKPFVDRKKSSTFHLVHRSQRDVASEVLAEGETNADGMVLWPSPHNLAETNQKVLATQQEASTMAAWREKLAKAGLLEDDPEKYLKPMTGTGTFLNATGKVEQAQVGKPETANMSSGEDALLEVERQFDSIPLTTEYMEEDIAEALFGDFDEGGFEELNDDFVLDAAAEPEGEEDEEAFNFDDHVRLLMEKAQKERQGGDGLPASHSDNAFFSKMKPFNRDGDDDEDEDADSWDQEFGVGSAPGVVPALDPEEEKALCEKFEQTLAEYDSDECGECPEEEIAGPRDVETDAQVDAALDEFMMERNDDFFVRGNRQIKHGGSGFSALVGKKMVPAEQLSAENPAEDEEEDKQEPVDEILAAASARLAEPAARPPAEEIFIDGKSYFSERERNPFDCDSILSTYSNLDNNPVTIEASRRRKKKKNKIFGISEEPVAPIQLSNKTGLPLGVLPTKHVDDDWDDTIISVNKGIARNREETKEEKKARKEQIKKERQMARIQKKATKEVFKEEFQKHASNMGADDVAGKTVFRYS